MQHLSLDQFADRVGSLLPRLMHNVWQYGHNQVTQGLVTLPQLWALEFLEAHRGATMRELADAMHSRSSTATALVDRLVRMELVLRASDERDRRIVRVEISPKGRTVLRQMNELMRRMVKKLFGRLGAGDRAAYLGILEKLSDLQERSAEPRVKGGAP